MVCKKCICKKRRNPENEKEFIRICIHCEEFYLRKILFEEFWNEKIRKEKEILMKKEEIALLQKKILLRKEKKEKKLLKKSALKMSEQLIGEIDESIANIESKMIDLDSKEKQLFEDQHIITDFVMKNSEILKSKIVQFEKFKAEKDFLKSQKIKDIHRKQDLQLKIKFFLEKILENNKIDRNSYVKISITRKNSLRNSSSRKESNNSEIFPIKSDKMKIWKNKDKYESKTQKIEDEKVNTKCGNCQSCYIF